MPRLRQPALAVPLRVGTVIAALVLGMPPAGAQDASQGVAADRLLMRPVVDGDPLNPPRFARPGGRSQDSSASGNADVPSFDYQPALGAGTTGFDSRNTKRKKAKGAKPGSRAKKVDAAAKDQAAPPPPELAATARLPQNQPRRGASPSAADVTGAPTDTTIASPRRRSPNQTSADPFAPAGVQVGAFVLKPAVDLTGAYDTNPARTTNGKPSWYSVVAPEMLINSNWARHELTATLRGSYTSYENASDLNRPSVDAKVNGRVDVTTTTRLDLEGRFLVGTDNPGSPNIQANLSKLPIYTTVGGTAGVTQQFSRLEVTLKGGADRTVFQNSSFTDGTTSSNDDRNFNRYSTQIRAGYELTPGVKPFVEVGVDSRVHDLAVDRIGVRRDSDGRYLKGGTTFELSRILTGDVAVGWIARTYKDPTLPDIGGLTFDSSLTWLASALTTVKLTAATSVDETTIAGVAGIFKRDVGIAVDHAFRRWLIATLKFTRGFDDYIGSARADDRYAASALLTYKLTRDLQLKAEYRREWQRSNAPGNDTTADVVLFGLRLQR